VIRPWLAPSIHGASGFLGPVAFLLFGRTGSPALDDFLFSYQVVPFAVMALALGASRSRLQATPALDLLAAALWNATLLFFALWHPAQARLGLLVCSATTVALVGSALVARVRPGRRLSKV